MRLRARHMHAIVALTDNVVGYLINLFLFWLVYNVIFVTAYARVADTTTRAPIS